MFRTFLKDERGATGIEYGMLLAIMALGILAAQQGLLETGVGLYTNMGEAFANYVNF